MVGLNGYFPHFRIFFFNLKKKDGLKMSFKRGKECGGLINWRDDGYKKWGSLNNGGKINL